MKKTISTMIVVVMLVGLIMGLSLGLVACNNAPDYIDPIDDNYRVFYQIFVGSFSDSNGDGIGDLRGIINRMDYLNDAKLQSGESLGVQGIWLSPIFKSSSYHKYDATNYYEIDPQFGTEADLKELIELCHSRNVKVILDLVLNHTSTQNEWFKAFRSAHQNGDAESDYYDFYSYATGSTMLSGSTYRQIIACPNEYYECNFDQGMPELNYDSELVYTTMLDIAKYYLDLGVDGYRFDAVKYIYYNNNPKSVEFWNRYISDLRAYKPDIYTVGECWDGQSVTLEYVEALNCFDFQIGQTEGVLTNAAKDYGISAYTRYIANYQSKVLEKNAGGMHIPFISNHDMDRSAGYLQLDKGHAHMAANLLMLSPGSPFIYYGEEIGMKGTRGGAMTDANRRLAMLWGDKDTVENPVGSTFDSAKQTNGTVKDHIKNDNSLMHRYSDLIWIRGQYPQIARGSYKAVRTSENSVGGFVITYEDTIIGLFHNTSKQAITIDLNTLNLYDAVFSAIGTAVGGNCSLNGTMLTIAPQTSVILV